MEEFLSFKLLGLPLQFQKCILSLHSYGIQDTLNLGIGMYTLSSLVYPDIIPMLY